jgi:hypothetical protein
VHAVFGSLKNDKPASGTPSLTLEPPSPQARITPFRTPPSACSAILSDERMNFTSYLRSARDQSVRDHHRNLGAESGGAELGEYWSFKDISEPLTPVALALFVDLFPNILPRLVNGKLPRSWFPTVTLSIEFKFPLSQSNLASSAPESHTLGIYTASRFVNGPQGRHDIYVELWTAPGEIGDGKPVDEGWREKQRCLAIAHQMALVVPFEANTKKANKL